MWQYLFFVCVFNFPQFIFCHGCSFDFVVVFIKFSFLCLSLSGLINVCIVLDCCPCWNLPCGLLKDCYSSSSSSCVCYYHTTRDSTMVQCDVTDGNQIESSHALWHLQGSARHFKIYFVIYHHVHHFSAVKISTAKIQFNYNV